MHIVSRLRAAVRPRRALWMLSLVFIPLLGACSDDGDGPTGNGGSVIGTWTPLGAEDQIYIQITNSVVRIYAATPGDCFARSVYDIVDQNDDSFTLEDQITGETFEAELSADGDDITVDGQPFVESDVDVTDLDVCTAPTLPACNTLTEITLGGNLVGELEETDGVDERGTLYDLYRIEVEEEAEWVVEMNSNELDTYLKLFTADGDLIDVNDDFSDGTDSRIDATLSLGCYIVMATSFGIGETGAYQVFFF